jgi:microcompartment protein CcmK/EutM
MYLGRVVGCVWATVKNPAMLGLRMLVVQPLTPELHNTGKQIICTDCTGAGSGEIVYWVRGKEASFPFLPAEPPVDTTIVGIVDSVHLRPAAPPLTKATPRTVQPVVQPKRPKAKPC